MTARRPTAVPHATIAPDGDAAFTVDFGGGRATDPHDYVVAFADRMASCRIPGVIETVPTYRSATIYYHPLVIPSRALLARLRRLLECPPGRRRRTRPVVTLPVCYSPEFGPDLEAVGAGAGLSPDEVARLHASVTYRVYMLGFLPGFPYMGHVPDTIAVPRLPTPRTSVPAGSVAIADFQTGIYPVTSPGGWRVIGRTPVRLYDPDRPSPFLLNAGDRVAFHTIDRAEFDRLAGR